MSSDISAKDNYAAKSAITVGASFAATKAVIGTNSMKCLRKISQLSQDEFDKLNLEFPKDRIMNKTKSLFSKFKKLSEKEGVEFNLDSLVSGAKASEKATKRMLPKYCAIAGIIGVAVGAIAGNIIKHHKTKS